MITGKTKSGFDFAFDERILNDWRFTNALVKSQKGTDYEKLDGANEMVRLLLGEEGLKNLVDYLTKKNDGFAPVDKLMLEVADIIETSKQTKN